MASFILSMLKCCVVISFSKRVARHFAEQRIGGIASVRALTGGP
jgi:hypothetical protein